VGLFVSLAFARFSAPDLALTQLLVEVVTILLVLLALYHLPEGEPIERARGRRVRDVALAGGIGAGAAALAWTVLGRAPFGGGVATGVPGDRVSDAAAYYLRESKPLGGGTNAVNVILVDFRGFDTLGEVTVLACAALGAAVLLERARPLPAAPARPYDPDRHPLVLAMLTRPFLPFALLLAAFLFLRGHDLPGGGFAAGLLAAVAVVSQYLTSGIEWTTDRLRLAPRRWIAVGVGLAALTGLGAMAFGRPFLTSFYEYVPVPVVGKVGIASALFFDLGVFVAVLGAVLLVLARLGVFAQASEPAPPVAPSTPAEPDDADQAALAGGTAVGVAAAGERA
jgi:multicomponent K+:H+ antiporter subunit A